MPVDLVFDETLGHFKSQLFLIKRYRQFNARCAKIVETKRRNTHDTLY